MKAASQRLLAEIFGENRNVRRAVITAAVGLPLLVAAMVVVLGVQWRLSGQVRGTVNASYETRLELQEVFSLLQDAETGQRGFMLTGKKTYLRPYSDATRNLRPHWASLTRRLSGDPRQLDRLNRLRALSTDKLSELDQTILLGLHGRRDEGLEIVSSGRGRLLMEQMRREISAMEETGQQQSDAALAQESALTRETGGFLAVLSVGLMLLLAAVALLLMRGLRAIQTEKDQATQANQAKSSFLAMMSHELRTPMNGVLGMAHVLSHSALSPDQRECVDVIETSGKGLLVVLNDILDLSKIEADHVELESVAFDLVDVIVQSANVWSNAVAEKGIRLELEGLGAREALYVLGDETRIRQILLNLLSNAVKFTEHGQIAIRLEVLGRSPGEYRIEIRDSGPGMSDEVCARLFQPFVQEDVSTTRRFGGTGLGLAISRRLARLMDGDLTVTSDKGKGTIFTLALPLAPAAPPPSRVEPVAIECRAGLNVLVAEDNLQNQMVVRAFLKAVGASATIVEDGAQAIAAARLGRFDLMMFDIHMPVMGGEEAMRTIRAEGGPCARIPIIALTADAMVGDRERYIAHGFDDHIAKPMEPGRFVEIVGRWSHGTEGIGESQDAGRARARPAV